MSRDALDMLVEAVYEARDDGHTLEEVRRGFDIAIQGAYRPPHAPEGDPEFMPHQPEV